MKDTELITCYLRNNNVIKLKHVGFYEGIEIGLLVEGSIYYEDGREVYSPSCIVGQDDIYLIVVYDWFYTEFTEEEQSIILAHEYGHKYYRGKDTISSENKADLYAVEKFNLDKVINFLKRFSNYYENGGNILERITWLLNEKLPI